MPSIPIPISGLNERLTVKKEDFIPFVESSSMTTYRVNVGNFDDSYFGVSGSVSSSIFASRSISASHAVMADTASWLYNREYVTTASFAMNVNWNSVVGTASLASHSFTSSRLEGIGSSYENSMLIYTDLNLTNSAYLDIAARKTITSSAITLPAIKANSVFLNRDYQLAGTFDYGKLYFFEDRKNQGKFIFELGDDYVAPKQTGLNIDNYLSSSKGFLFQTMEAGNVSGLQRTSSLLYISASGQTFGRAFEAQEYSSSLRSSNKVGFFGTASWAMNAITSAFALTIPDPFFTGMIIAWPSNTPPSGWLTCNGAVYNPITYPGLGALIGTNYGNGLVIEEQITPETDHIGYHDYNNGSIRIRWVSGGSGVFTVLWGVTTYYLNAGATSVTIGSLNAAYPGGTNYAYTFTDYGVTPNLSYPRTAHLPIQAAPVTVTTTPYTLNSAAYRLPNMTQDIYFKVWSTLNPMTWIIKAG